MNDRARAIALLQQARDILSERLTERLLESRDAILEDALGLAYSSEIDAILEQVGQRLNNVNVMLNNLPPLDEAPAPQPDDLVPLAPAPVLGYEPPSTESSNELPTAEAVVAPPQPTSVIYLGADGENSVAPGFPEFVRHTLAGDRERAAVVLAALLDLPVDRARECAERFRTQVREQPQFLQKAAGLRQELAAGSLNGALILLWECFGLQGMESVAALQTLRARLAAGNSTAPST